QLASGQGVIQLSELAQQAGSPLTVAARAEGGVGESFDPDVASRTQAAEVSIGEKHPSRLHVADGAVHVLYEAGRLEQVTHWCHPDIPERGDTFPDVTR